MQAMLQTRHHSLPQRRAKETNGTYLNVLRLPWPEENVIIDFAEQKTEGALRVYFDEIPVEVRTQHYKNKPEPEFVYTKFDGSGPLKATISLKNNPRFARHYFAHKLTSFLRQHAACVTNDFIRNPEAWVESTLDNKAKYTTYDRFCFRFSTGRFSDGLEMTISYRGQTYVAKQPHPNFSAYLPFVSKGLYNGKILSTRRPITDTPVDYSKWFPVLNRALALASHIDLPKSNPKPDAKDSVYWKIGRKLKLINQLLAGIDKANSYFNFGSAAFVKVEDTDLQKVHHAGLKLEFKDGGRETDPMEGMHKFGPYSESPWAKMELVVFAHVQQEQSQLPKLLSHINPLQPNSKDETFSKVLATPFQKMTGLTLKPENIYFIPREQSPVDFISTVLSSLASTNGEKRVALYLSPFSKFEKNPHNLNRYFRLKELFLRYEIPLQVIFERNIDSESFRYHIPNLAVAILAKAGGIPWRLADAKTSDLIVGLGAYKAKGQTRGYIGTATCFASDGRFHTFNCLRAGETKQLAGSIKQTLETYRLQHPEVKRVIIHFYKQMSRREIKPIEDMLNTLGLNLDVFIVTVHKTLDSDLVLFDKGHESLMPPSGTYLKTGRQSYLLFNNTRYDAGAKEKSYPLPVRLHLKSTKEGKLTDGLAAELLDQVYQFSHLYWKSVSHQHLPVTVKYSELIARQFAFFEDKALPEIGVSALWFL